MWVREGAQLQIRNQGANKLDATGWTLTSHIAVWRTFKAGKREKGYMLAETNHPPVGKYEATDPVLLYVLSRSNT
jgi:hypothetical protein